MLHLINYTFWYHLAIYSEMLMTVILQLDIYNTIKNPFKRADRVHHLKRIAKLGLLLILILCVSSVIHGIKEVNKKDYDTLHKVNIDDVMSIYLNKVSLDLTINEFYNSFSVWINGVYTLTTIFCLISTLSAVCSNASCLKCCRKQAMDTNS